MRGDRQFLGWIRRPMHYGEVAPKQPRTTKPRRPAVSPEEEQLFHEAIAGATPLSGRDRVRMPPPRTAIIKPEPLPPRVALTVEGGGDEISARAPGVNRLQVAALRGGKVRVEDTLDLHGHTVAQALPLLERFLLDAARARRRCVLIVHGKGLHSGGVAVLRDAVFGALAGEMSGLVQAFTTAPPADGGTGATIVLVRS
jgi:DNA-nicking Smr family endonuclease